MQSRVRIVIGSGEASRIWRNMLSALREHCSRKLDIRIFDGTHNAIERNAEPPVRATLLLDVKYRNYIEFNLYRFLIPQLCEHQGRAIWIDSEIIYMKDITEQLDGDMHGSAVLKQPDDGDPHRAKSPSHVDYIRCEFAFPRD